MGVTKIEIFSESQNKIAAIAKALGHPARIAILQQLIEHKTCICGDLVNEIGLAQATISQHLRELKAANIIKGNIEGTSVCYCINKSTLAGFKDVLVQLFDEALKNEKDCC